MTRSQPSALNGSSPDGEFHLRSFECLGACDIAPMASIEGHYRGPLDNADAAVIAEHLRNGGSPAEVLPEKHYVGDFGRRERPSAGKPADGSAEGL